MTSNIRSSYRKNPLKGYHFGDDGIYDFEENENGNNEGEEDGNDFDLDEWRSRIKPMNGKEESMHTSSRRDEEEIVVEEGGEKDAL